MVCSSTLGVCLFLECNSIRNHFVNPYVSQICYVRGRRDRERWFWFVAISSVWGNFAKGHTCGLTERNCSMKTVAGLADPCFWSLCCSKQTVFIDLAELHRTDDAISQSINLSLSLLHTQYVVIKLKNVATEQCVITLYSHCRLHCSQNTLVFTICQHSQLS